MAINSILTKNDEKKSFDYEKKKIIKVIDKILNNNHTITIVTITSESVSRKDLTSRSKESFDLFRTGFMDLKIEKSESKFAANMIQIGLDLVKEIVTETNSSKVILFYLTLDRKSIIRK